jgi:hypothetical protein
VYVPYELNLVKIKNWAQIENNHRKQVELQVFDKDSSGFF